MIRPGWGYSYEEKKEAKARRLEGAELLGGWAVMSCGLVEQEGRAPGLGKWVRLPEQRMPLQALNKRGQQPHRHLRKVV